MPITEADWDAVAALRATDRQADQRRTAQQQLAAIPQRADQIRRDLARALGKAAQIDVAKEGTDARDRAVTKARDTAAAQLAALRQQAEKIATDTAAWTSKQGPRDVNEQLLNETRQGRAWARVKAELDAGRSVNMIVTAARAAGDHQTLQAIRAELPSYLDAGTAGGRHVRAGAADVTAVMKEVTAALAETLPDTHGERSALRARLATDTASEAATRALDGAERAAERYSDERSPEHLRKALRALDVADNGGTVVGIADGQRFERPAGGAA